MVHMAAHTGNPTSPDQIEPGSRPVLQFDPELIATARNNFAAAHERVKELISQSEAIMSPEQLARDNVSITSAVRIAGFGHDCLQVLEQYSAQLDTAAQILATTMQWYLTTDEGKSHAMADIGQRFR
jgi:hypothetical protein